MLSKAYLLAKIGFDTAENEAAQKLQKLENSFRPKPLPPFLVIQENGNNAVPSGVSTGCLTVRRVQWVQPFPPAHNLIIPQPRSSLPSRRCILPHRNPASLNQSRAGAPRGARGLFLQRKTPRAERGAFLSCFFFPSCLFLCFSLFFETPRLRFKKSRICCKIGRKEA